MVRKSYTDKEYSDKACEANAEGKKLIKVQEERPYNVEVYEYKKKTIEVPVIDPETGKPTGETETIEVDDLDKPIMVEETIINPITGEEETILVHKHHTETRTEIVEYLEIVNNPENFQRNFFNTSLGYVRRKPFVKGTKEYKDFLSDMLAGMEVGQQIITYAEDLQPNLVQITQEFLDECKEQYNRDFYGG
jgi:hypothetical protein